MPGSQHASPRAALVDQGEFFDGARDAAAFGFTMPWWLARDTLSPTSATVYGSLCRVRRAGTVTKIRMYRVTSGSGITDVRVGLVDPTLTAAPAWLGESINLVADATWTAGTGIRELPLAAGVAVVEGQLIVPVLGIIASTTVPDIRGVLAFDATLGSRTSLSGQPMAHSKSSGFTTGNAMTGNVTLTGHASANLPWFELI